MTIPIEYLRKYLVQNEVLDEDKIGIGYQNPTLSTSICILQNGSSEPISAYGSHEMVYRYAVEIKIRAPTIDEAYEIVNRISRLCDNRTIYKSVRMMPESISDTGTTAVQAGSEVSSQFVYTTESREISMTYTLWYSVIW